MNSQYKAASTKIEFIMWVSTETSDLVEESLKYLAKIKKLDRNVDLHGQEILVGIVKKLKEECNYDHSDAF